MRYVPRADAARGSLYRDVVRKQKSSRPIAAKKRLIADRMLWLGGLCRTLNVPATACFSPAARRSCLALSLIRLRLVLTASLFVGSVALGTTSAAK